MRIPLAILSLILMLPGLSARADGVSDRLKELTTEARSRNPGFNGFSPTPGRQFFSSLHGNDWSCASCHTRDPRQTGKHAVTGRLIRPMAPAANPERFTDSAKTEKWFRRNCKDVVGRECTAQEKGDVLSWLQSLK